MGDFRGKRAELGMYDDAFGDIDDLIKRFSKLQNNAPKKVWLTTSNVYDDLMKDVTSQRGQFVIVPEGTFPEGVHAIELSEAQCIPNRVERRKRQRATRKEKR